MNDISLQANKLLGNFLLDGKGLVLLFSFAVNILHLVIPLFTLQLFDRVLMSESVDTLIWLTCIAVFMLAIQALLEWVRSQFMLRKALNFEVEHNHKAFNNAIDESVKLGQPNTLSISDVSTVRDSLSSQSIFAIFDAPFSPVFLFVLYLLHPYLGLFATVGIVILMTLTVITQRKSNEEKLKTGPITSTFNRMTSDWLTQAKTVESAGFKNSLSRKWQAERKSIIMTSGYYQNTIRNMSAIAKFIRILLQVGLLVVCVNLILGNQISAGVLIAASMLMARVLSPIDQAIHHWAHWKNGFKAYQRVMKRTAHSNDSPLQLPPLTGDIQALDIVMNNVASLPPLIQKSSFHIKAGTIVGVVGETGSGKSELVKALLGLTPTAGGEVKLDNASLDQWDNKIFGQQVGYLTQDSALLSGTVTQNICRFDAIDEPKEIINAAQKADAHKMILSLPQGYQTLVGDVGMKLSKGQVQKIALAMTIYRTPALMVLDEPDNGLDHKGLMKLYELIEQNRQAKVTTLIVSHKASLLSRTDEVLVIKGDRTVEHRLTAQYLNLEKVSSSSIGGGV